MLWRVLAFGIRTNEALQELKNRYKVREFWTTIMSLSLSSIQSRCIPISELFSSTFSAPPSQPPLQHPPKLERTPTKSPLHHARQTHQRDGSPPPKTSQPSAVKQRNTLPNPQRQSKLSSQHVFRLTSLTKMAIFHPELAMPIGITTLASPLLRLLLCFLRWLRGCTFGRLLDTKRYVFF